MHVGFVKKNKAYIMYCTTVVLTDLHCAYDCSTPIQHILSLVRYCTLAHRLVLIIHLDQISLWNLNERIHTWILRKLHIPNKWSYIISMPASISGLVLTGLTTGNQIVGVGLSLFEQTGVVCALQSPLHFNAFLSFAMLLARKTVLRKVKSCPQIQ